MSFKSWDSFRTFSQTTRHGNRYIFNKEIEAFLRVVLETGKQRENEAIKAGAIFWRAQLGHEWCSMVDNYGEIIDKLPQPYSHERMKPISFSATEGRANPKGIPYLYLATDKQVAMSEVRPWVGPIVSVGQFKTMRDLRLIDCSVQHGQLVNHH